MTRAEFDEDWAASVSSLAANAAIQCKVSGLVTEASPAGPDAVFEPYLDRLFECFGQQHLMYGSDWPVCLLMCSCGETLRLIERYAKNRGIGLSRVFWSGNAIAFYGLRS